MYSSEESISFWPAFSDSMLAVVLVLLLVIAAVYFVPPKDVQQIRRATDCQSALESQLRRTGMEFKQDSQDKLLLRISFPDSALFPADHAELSEAGKAALRQLAGGITTQREQIVEIQIRGHADTVTTHRFKNNLHLGSERADSVFDFLSETGISPEKFAMSATSYGEFFPVKRTIGERFTHEQLLQYNESAEDKQKNRRIELVLRYGTKTSGCRAEPG